jgi:Amt family ammonium transporter
LVAGLATITPASGFVTVPGALVIGLMAGVVCYLGVGKLKAALGYDDSLDVFGVHGLGSTVGMLMCGLLAAKEINPAIATAFQVNGQPLALIGSVRQFWCQFQGVVFTMALAGIATFLILKVVDATVGLRLNEEEETLGLDLTQHGESAYNE